MAASDAIPLPSPWTARWISPAEESPDAADRPAFLLARDFEVFGPPSDAVLHITALGIYEVFLNGVRVGDHELAPGATTYDQTLYAQTFQVTELLRAGKNEIQALLSDGWFRGRNGGMQHRDVWGRTTGLLAELTWHTPNGPDSLVTDESWVSRSSEVVRADLMQGQTTDFSAVRSEPVAVRVGVVDAPEPTRSPAPPVRRIRSLLPVKVTAPATDVTIFDFGQNISGWVRLTDLGAPGQQTDLLHGEHVNPDGDLVTAHLDLHSPAGDHVPCHQIDRVIAGPQAHVFEPRHTVHGFRYVRVSHPGRSLDPSSIEAIEVRTDLRWTSSFHSSDASLDQLHEMAQRTFLANAVDIPTDCPTRERAAWTGDFQVFAPLAATLFDISGFAAKWLASLRDDQFEDGCLPMYAPDFDRMSKNPEHPARQGGGSAGWGDAAVAVPWAIYQHYGNEQVLSDNWEMMNAWVDFALRSARSHRHRSRDSKPELPHEQYIWDGTFHFGEWCEPRPPGVAEADMAAAYKALLEADRGEVATAYLFRSLLQVSWVATILGNKDRASELGRLADEVRAAWITEYLDPTTGHTKLDTQAAYVRALSFGLLPAEHQQAAVDRLTELIHAASGHLSTGFLSTGLLLPTLADHGRPDLAFALLRQVTAPSWLAMPMRGATTYWENWEGVDEDGFVQPGSLNHYSKGAAMRFFYTHILGLQQAHGSAGWTNVNIRPHVGGGLTSAAGHVDTAVGRIDLGWEVVESQLQFSIILPDGMTGHVALPDGSHQNLGPGRHHLRAWLSPEQ